MKAAQHHTSWGQGKSKPPWAMTSHMLEWLLSKRQEKINVGEDVEKRESLCSVGRNVYWFSHYEKHSGFFSNNQK